MSRRGARRATRRRRAVVASVLLAAAVTAVTGGCTTESRLTAGGAPPSSTTVTVLAAASLTEPLTTLARQYERTHGVKVALSFGSSTTLAQQVAEGAPADLVAFAGTSALDLLPGDATGQGGRATIARNTMEIATPPDNPGGVRSLADLAKPELDVVLCASTVPCGKAADTVLSRARLTPHVVSREVDVKATLAKVRLGEADAAVVYHSDVVSAGDGVKGVVIPPAENTTLDYPLVWLNTKPDTTRFAELVRGATGRDALTRAGFLAP